MTGIRGERLSESTWQAENFLACWRRLGAADQGGAFRRWARSKDFAPKVARRIASAVELQTGKGR